MHFPQCFQRLSFLRVFLKSGYCGKELQDRLIVCCLMPFSTVFQFNCGGQCTYPCCPGVLLHSILHNSLSNPLAAFPHDQLTIVKTADRIEFCGNDHQSVLRKRNWGWNQRPPVLKSARQPTDLWSLAELQDSILLSLHYVTCTLSASLSYKILKFCNIYYFLKMFT